MFKLVHANQHMSIFYVDNPHEQFMKQKRLEKISKISPWNFLLNLRERTLLCLWPWHVALKMGFKSQIFNMKICRNNVCSGQLKVTRVDWLWVRKSAEASTLTLKRWFWKNVGKRTQKLIRIWFLNPFLFVSTQLSVNTNCFCQRKFCRRSRWVYENKNFSLGFRLLRT